MGFGSRFAASVSFALAISISPLPVQGQQGTINGRVADAETGEAVSGAAVEVLGQAGSQGTNASGRFTFTLAPGTYSLVVSLIGYERTPG